MPCSSSDITINGPLSLVVNPLLRLSGALAYDGLLEVVKLRHVRTLSDVEVRRNLAVGFSGPRELCG